MKLVRLGKSLKDVQFILITVYLNQSVQFGIPNRMEDFKFGFETKNEVRIRGFW